MFCSIVGMQKINFIREKQYGRKIKNGKPKKRDFEI